MSRQPGSADADIDAYVAAHGARFLTWLAELVALPSVSATGEGMAECSERLAGLARMAGLDVEILPTGGAPLVLARLGDDPARPTLLVTTHYDVQPVEPLDAWHSPPYVLTRRGDRLFGRGASDAKGPVIAVLGAVEAARAAGVLEGVNLKIVFDGEEEIGSPSLPAALDIYRERLAADAVLTFDGNSMPDGRPVVNFGGGGILYLDLEVRTARNDIHANRGALVPNAAWRLVWALASLKDAAETVLVPGFADALTPISEADRALLTRDDWNDEAELRSLGAVGFLPGAGGAEALHLLPILGIASLEAGHAGEGVSAVLPAKARARLYVGLRHAQDPSAVAGRIRAHLDAGGFGDVRMNILAATEPSCHDTNSQLGRMVVDELTRCFSVGPAIYPRANWYGRQASWIGERLGAHACQVAMVAPPQPNNHGPNEYIEKDYFFRGIGAIARILGRASGLPRRSDATYGRVGPL